MFRGEPNLSRARGTKAQQRRNQSQYIESPNQENTIDFQKATRASRRHIELIPKSRAQEKLIVNLLDESVPVVVALGPAGTGKSYLAMLAALHPAGVVAASVFVATIFVGADAMSRATGVPSFIADVIMAVALLAMLVALLFATYRVRT